MSDDLYAPIGPRHTIVDGNLRCGACGYVVPLKSLREAAQVGDAIMFCLHLPAARCPINEVYEGIVNDFYG